MELGYQYTQYILGVGLFSKLRHYVSEGILKKLYYALKNPFLIYGIIVWWNTYTNSLNPSYMLQNKEERIITFSRFDQHSSPLFKCLNIRNFLTLSLFIFHYLCINLIITYFPFIFHNFFTSVNKIHKYNTRFAANQSYYLPKVKTNYGIFNIRFQGPSVWNSVDEDTKSCSIALDKFKLKQCF